MHPPTRGELRRAADGEVRGLDRPTPTSTPLHSRPVNPLDQDHRVQLAPYLPMFDPDAFSDPEFYVELERIGYRQVLLGGTGTAGLTSLVKSLKRATKLEVILYPGGPAALAEADLVILPDVMNSNSHYARPFGSGSVATAMNIMQQGLPFIPVAYFIMGNSTARWFYDAFTLPSDKILLAYATYARMVGYRYLALDYEDPKIDITPKLIAKLREIPDMHMVISDEFDEVRGKKALEMGADTLVTPSNLYEDAADPLGFAARMHAALLG